MKAAVMRKATGPSEHVWEPLITNGLGQFRGGYCRVCGVDGLDQYARVIPCWKLAKLNAEPEERP